MAEIMRLGRSEPGVVRYNFHADWSDPLCFALHEEWQTKEDHDAHFNGETMQAMVPRFFSLLAEEPEVVYYDATVESRLGG